MNMLAKIIFVADKIVFLVLITLANFTKSDLRPIIKLAKRNWVNITRQKILVSTWLKRLRRCSISKRILWLMSVAEPVI